MKFKNRYSPSQGRVLDQTGEESLTRQSEADSCDINKIMERFTRTGQLPVTVNIPARYGDARIPDFQTAQQIVNDAKNAFNELPAKVRQHFGHDPKNFLEALNSPSPEVVDLFLQNGVAIEREESPQQVLKQIAKNTEKSLEKKSGNSDPT